MRAVIDTCVIVDVLQSRKPFCEDAQAVLLLAANRQFEGFLTEKAVVDIYYLTHRIMHNGSETKAVLTKLCTLFRLLDTTALDIRNAIAAEDVSDFEDAVMIETAVRSGMDCIVTRNPKDYAKAKLPVYAPADFIHLMTEHPENDPVGICSILQERKRS